MNAISLQSGSNGNCIYVECGKTRLLFDAGISGARAQRSLELHGRDIRKADAVIISHDHHDHVCSSGIYHRKFGLPVFMTRRTAEAARRCMELGPIGELHYFHAGETLNFGDLKVRTIPTPHDGAEAVAFVVESRSSRLGILTDLGHVFADLHHIVASLDAVFLESNYEPEMLEHGPYPEFLKARIRGPRGHISNHESAALLAESAGRGMKWACLAHLSENNNTPQTALNVHRHALGGRIDLHVASRYQPSQVFRV